MKFLFDMFFSFFGLFALSPILFIISILIKIDSKGTIFYLQKRIGKNQTEFKLFKFRTMSADSEKKGLLTIGEKDTRITKIGYYLRKYKLDELPQLINILKNDMSFVGPRPEVKKYVDLYSPQQKKVLSIKPGITDYASIEYVNENEILAKSDKPEFTYINKVMPHKLKLNLKYIEEMNFFVDLKIIFQTIIKIIKKR